MIKSAHHAFNYETSIKRYLSGVFEGPDVFHGFIANVTSTYDFLNLSYIQSEALCPVLQVINNS